MLKKVNYILNIVISSLIGVFIGHGLYVFWDYQTHPDLYAMMSTPWYTSILVYLSFTMVTLTVVVVIKLMIHRKLK